MQVWRQSNFLVELRHAHCDASVTHKEQSVGNRIVIQKNARTQAGEGHEVIVT